MLTDLLPAGLSYVTDTESQGTYDPSSGLWAVGTVATGSPATLTLSARVDSPLAQTNAASVTRADQSDPEHRQRRRQPPRRRRSGPTCPSDEDP